MQSIFQNTKREIKFFKKNKELFLLTLPGSLFVLVFAYTPMAGLILAFKNFNPSKGIWGSDWVGFDNFKFFFTSQDAFRVTRNTILLNASFIILGLIFSIILALMLQEVSGKARRLYQTVMFFPYFLSWVVISFVLFALLNMDLGVFNNILKSLGFDAVQWYAEPKYWVGILIFSYLWKNLGYYSIIYYTGLIGIDPSYYESAEIDGASKLRQIKDISLPLLTPMIVLMTLLQIGQIFHADFGLFYFLPRNIGALYPVVDVIDTYVYRSLRVVGDTGMAAAVGFYQSIVGFVLVLLSNFVIKKINGENAIF